MRQTRASGERLRSVTRVFCGLTTAVTIPMCRRLAWCWSMSAGRVGVCRRADTSRSACWVGTCQRADPDPVGRPTPSIPACRLPEASLPRMPRGGRVIARRRSRGQKPDPPSTFSSSQVIVSKPASRRTQTRQSKNQYPPVAQSSYWRVLIVLQAG